jgi:amino acid adenylation domain-containing protein
MSREELANPRSTNDLVYCFFTSGTTGKPKGVLMEQKSLVHRQTWMAAKMPLGPGDAVVQKTDYNFGISEWEFFWPLQVGARLVIAKPDGHKDQVYLLELLQKERITAATFVPSLLQMLMEHMAMEKELKTTHIKYMLCCGEKLHPHQAKSFHDAFDGQLMNLMGPTETDMIQWVCTKPVPSTIPIGSPIDNSVVYVLDENLQPVRTGEPGEMCVATGSARGYLNRPDETKTKFIPDPFNSRNKWKMYRTGDKVVREADGVMRLIGRMDNQVKLRGYRIELGEIESILSLNTDVKQCLAIITGETTQEQMLVAYVTPANLDVAELKASLEAALPKYMVPSFIIPLDQFELTERGKIDRGKLPPPVLTPEPKLSAPFKAACTPMQEKVEEIWREVLKASSPLSVDAKFPELGGNSLLAGKATSMLRAQTGAKLPGTAMYTHPTIEAIAELVEERGGRSDFQPEEVRNSDAEDLVQWQGGSSSSITTMFFSFCIIIAHELLDNAVIAVVALCLALGHGFSTWQHCVQWVLILAASEVAMTLFVFVFSIAVKWLVVGRIIPGEFPAHGSHVQRLHFVEQLVNDCFHRSNYLIGGTPLASCWLSCLGCRIGKNVVFTDVDTIGQAWDTVTIGDDVVFKEDASVSPKQVEAAGMCYVRTVTVESGCYVAEQALVVSGSTVKAGTYVGPLSSTGIGVNDMKPVPEEVKEAMAQTQMAPRLLAGMPLCILTQGLAQLPVIWLFITMFNALSLSLGTGWQFAAVLAAATIYLFSLVEPECVFLVTVIFKWVIIGRFKEGTSTAWIDFKRWVMGRLVVNASYEESMITWIGTELLSAKHMMLGCKVGTRVQADHFRCCEHDLVEIGNDVVFGTHVCIYPTDFNGSKKIVIEDKANVLDHVVVMPGAHLRKGAVLGSNTIACAGSKFPEHSVSAGNVGGKAVLLQTRSKAEIDGTYPFLPRHERELTLEALRRHSTWYWYWSYNIAVMMSVSLLQPMDPSLEYAMLAAVAVYGSTGGYSISAAVVFYCVVYPLLFIILNFGINYPLKWALIGKWKEGYYPFYSFVHISFMVLISRRFPTHLQPVLPYFSAFYMMALGANIEDRKQSVIRGTGLEYDLLTIEKNAVINTGVDMTCHTVENMLIKLAPVTYKSGVVVCEKSSIMPGASMEKNSVLRELSQVLKGENVPSMSTYAGLPALSVD